MVRWLAAAMVAAVLSGCGGGDDSSPESPEPTRLEVAFEKCTVSETKPGRVARMAEHLSLGDEGRTITVAGYGDATSSYLAATCVLTQLDVPGSTMSLFTSTNSLMGRQTDSWDGFDMSWSYHPDSGVNAVIEEAEESEGP